MFCRQACGAVIDSVGRLLKQRKRVCNPLNMENIKTAAG